MRHFVAYHNEAEMGEDHDPLGVYTSKAVVKESKGQIVWLIHGKESKSPKAYYLASRFVVEQVNPCGAEEFEYEAHGKGTIFLPNSIRLNNLAWFPKLKDLTGSFGFGFTEIKDPRVIQYLEQLIAQHTLT